MLVALVFAVIGTGSVYVKRHLKEAVVELSNKSPRAWACACLHILYHVQSRGVGGAGDIKIG